MEKIYDRTIPSVTEAKRRINELYEKSFVRTGVIDSRVIAGISQKLIEDLNKKNISIDNTYIHSISDTQIHHSLLEHSDPVREKNRNQIPIRKSDFGKIIEVLNSYDSIRLSKNNRGLNCITYAKLYSDGTIIYVEEIRTGRKVLSFSTLYKKDCYGGLSTKLSDTSETAPYSHLSKSKDTTKSKKVKKKK